MNEIPPVLDTATKIKIVCDEVRCLLIKKNASYGDSALAPTRIFSKLPADEAIRVRIDDKLSRVMKGNDAFNEDTVLDLLGYFVLLRCTQKWHDPPAK